MLDKWRYKRQNKGVLNTKKRGVLNAKKWCVKRQFRRFRCQNLFLKLTPVGIKMRNLGFSNYFYERKKK